MISDEDLLLYYYRDGLDDAGRARIADALTRDAELAQRLHKLVARLDAVAVQPEVPVPAAAQQRWQAALERAAQADGRIEVLPVARRRRPRYFDGRWLAVAATIAVIALVTVLQLTRDPAAKLPSPGELTAGAGAVEASAYERGLKFHLASTERQLADIGTATPEERARLIATIADQNRVYALAAERAGEPQLARVLRAFAPVLDDLARERGDSSENIAQLGFELRVMQGRLGGGAAPAGSPSTSL
jgi:hypothetical protein